MTTIKSIKLSARVSKLFKNIITIITITIHLFSNNDRDNDPYFSCQIHLTFFCTSNILHHLCDRIIFYHHHQFFNSLKTCKNISYQATPFHKIF